MKPSANFSQQRNSNIIRIFSKEKKDVAGCGFYLGGALLITCAHVINDALGLTKQSIARPKKYIQVDFPLLDHNPKEKPTQFKANIHKWIYDGKSLDIAILTIHGQLPSQVSPAQLFFQADENIEKDDVYVFGYPYGNEIVGGWHHGTVISKVGDGLFQITEKQGYSIQPGYSGSPVWDDKLNVVIGMISQAHLENRAGFMLPIKQIQAAWPSLNVLITLQKANDLYQQKLFSDFIEQLSQIEDAHLSDPEIKKHYLATVISWGRDLYTSGLIEFAQRLFAAYDQLEPENPEIVLGLEKIKKLQQLINESLQAYEQNQWQTADEKLSGVTQLHNNLDKAQKLHKEVSEIRQCLEFHDVGNFSGAFKIVLNIIDEFPESKKAIIIFQDVYEKYVEQFLVGLVLTYLDLDQGDKSEDYEKLDEGFKTGFDSLKNIQQNLNLQKEDDIAHKNYLFNQGLNIVAETLDERKNHDWFHDVHIVNQLLTRPDHNSIFELFYLQALLESEISKWIVTPGKVDLQELYRFCSNKIEYLKTDDSIFNQVHRLRGVVDAIQTITNEDSASTLIQLESALHEYPRSLLFLLLIRKVQIENGINQIIEYVICFVEGRYDQAYQILDLLNHLNTYQLPNTKTGQAAFRVLQDQLNELKGAVAILKVVEKPFKTQDYETALDILRQQKNNEHISKVYYEILYLYGKQLFDKQDWFKAFYVFDEIVKFDYRYKKAAELLERCIYKRAELLVQENNFKDAKIIFEDLPSTLASKQEIRDMEAKIGFLDQPENQEIEKLFILSPSKINSLDERFESVLKTTVVKRANDSIQNKNFDQALNILNKADKRYSGDKKLQDLHTEANSGLFREWLIHKFMRPALQITGVLVVVLLCVKIFFSAFVPSPISPILTSTPSVSLNATVTTAPTATLAPTGFRVDTCNPPQAIPDIPIGNRMIRWEGVSSFSVENSPPGTILNNHVRSIYADEGGAWLGYLAGDPAEISGLSHFDHKVWENCNSESGFEKENINAILKDSKGRLWIATENKGVYLFNDKSWRSFSGLPSEKTYGLSIDNDDAIWASTWEGAARFDEKEERWNIVYSTEKGTLSNNHIHAIAFSQSGDIWIGFIAHGVDRFNNKSGQWEHYDTLPNGLCGEQIRRIAIRNNPETKKEEVWFSTVDAGVCQFSEGEWTSYELPSKIANDIQIDSLNRVWTATDAGVLYWDSNSWQSYTTIASDAIAFGPDCKDCPFTSEDILIGTKKFGMTHSKLPHENMIEILDACFVINGQRQCGQITEVTPQKITIRPKQILLPGQKVFFELVVSPKSPYKLQTGDFLSYIMQDESYRYGAYLIVPVKELILAGQKYTLTDVDNPLVAPTVANGETKIFSNLWKLWMDRRYTGPIIQIELNVSKPVSTKTPTLTPTAIVHKDSKGHLMVLIPAGEFSMGNENGSPDEKPAHQVFLNNYYIDQFEVTNAQYRKCVDEPRSGCDLLTENFRFQNTTDDYRNHPVVSVTWKQAESFCEWRGGRLPTEAEWEKAARGNSSNIYPWGNTDPTCEISLFGGCFKNSSGRADTMPIGTHPKDASPYGVFDMGGSVIEWIWDWYSDNYYVYFKSSPFPDPLGPDTPMSYRVTRGGGWSPDGYIETNRIRVSDRGQASPNDRYVNFGFRCVTKP